MRQVASDRVLQGCKCSAAACGVSAAPEDCARACTTLILLRYFLLLKAPPAVPYALRFSHFARFMGKDFHRP